MQIPGHGDFVFSSSSNARLNSFMMKKETLIFFFVAIVSLLNCKSSKDSNVPVTTDFAKGADVGWLTQMEAAGIKFYNSSDTQQDCMQILKDKGMNSIRLRAWVH